MKIELDNVTGLITITTDLGEQTVEVWETDGAVHQALMEVVSALKRKRKEYIADEEYWGA